MPMTFYKFFAVFVKSLGLFTNFNWTFYKFLIDFLQIFTYFLQILQKIKCFCIDKICNL